MFFNGLRPEAEKCCGCEGCRSICPKSAIRMIQDEDGFIFPQVDPELCIECGLCEKVCPMYHGENIVLPGVGDAYAAVSNNESELSQSSSGGIFSLIADYVLENGGLVCGAAFEHDLRLHHIMTEDIRGLHKLRGSKYLQSRVGDILKEIKLLLDSKKYVYFVGTGCQVAALKLFLRKDYKNLITSDILCHGVPPQSVFDKMIEALERKYSGKVESYSFRDKSIWGWSCSSSSSVRIDNRLKYLGNEPLQQAYFNAFLKGDNYRESCYVCPYAQRKRTGDITLGDFWGVENYIPVKNVRKGVSAILVNTEKGRNILTEIKRDLMLYPASIEDIEVINRTLIRPTHRPDARERFYRNFRADSTKTLMEYYVPNKKHDLLYLLKRNPMTSNLIILVKKILRR